MSNKIYYEIIVLKNGKEDNRLKFRFGRDITVKIVLDGGLCLLLNDENGMKVECPYCNVHWSLIEVVNSLNKFKDDYYWKVIRNLKNRLEENPNQITEKDLQELEEG